MTFRKASHVSAEGIDPQLRNLAIVVVLGAIMTVLDATIVNVAIASLGRDFGAPLSTVHWVVTGYTLALSMAVPLSGWSVRRFGARTMWLVSIGAFVGGSLLCGLAWTLPSLIAFRVLQGVGGGMLLPVGQMMLAREAGPERMGHVMSIVSVPAMFAPLLGPILGGVILEGLDWRWMFFVNLPICALAVVAALWVLPRDIERSGDARLDTVGMLLLCPGLAILVYGLSEAGNGTSLTGTRFLASVSAGAVLVAAFVAHALRMGDGALIDLRRLGTRAFTTATGGLFLYSGAMFGVMILVPLFAGIVRGQSALDAGWLLAPMGAGAMITMSVSGRLSDRYGGRWFAVGGVLCVLVGVLVLTTIGPGTGRAVIMVAMFGVGLGHGLIAPCLLSMAYQGLPRTAVPAATTGANILVRVGSSFGTAVMAVILQIAIRDEVPGASGNLGETAGRHASDMPALTNAFTETFWWVAAILFISLLPILAIPRKSKEAHAHAL
ncbi:EmrB/QacA subfamily drug resistance transporter [Actinomadura pelletieri DSM 43383]|uniref:EmrB/QacA subfamily drug resistance transporter n=1 Tax=Actinomadura pelletieri DSM 43383 TaxID=1120940 RepID=A0A495QFT8_9ACTN|nr:DHA2 family efflux MFS transporter permease subunit [Actinomadura pelletieri]RKS70719.1 EmrB/QacA subfamily drug resistance transporter [Actinomadura pelletieri DSM 43383]